MAATQPDQRKITVSIWKLYYYMGDITGFVKKSIDENGTTGISIFIPTSDENELLSLIEV